MNVKDLCDQSLQLRQRSLWLRMQSMMLLYRSRRTTDKARNQQQASVLQGYLLQERMARARRQQFKIVGKKKAAVA